jgi:hypothetical protein
MKENPKYSDADKPLQVNRGRVDSVNLYEVKEDELNILENGEPTSIFLNFAIFLLSIAFSAILTLCTATFKSDLIQYAFLFVSIIGGLGGFLLAILWLRGRKSIRSIVRKIRDRIPSETNFSPLSDLRPESEDEKLIHKE